MGIASLDGIPFRIDPRSVTWDFKMKVCEAETLGGKVIQVIGTELGDMVVKGVFGYGDRSKGDTMGWEDQERFYQRLSAYTRQEARDRDPMPVRFLYPPSNWDFTVYVKRLDDPIRLANEIFNPEWTLTLFLVRDNTGVVVSGIKDLYIQRLMAGIGWGQTVYNGPLDQAAVNDYLVKHGGTAGESVRQFEIDKAAEALANNSQTQTGRKN